MGDRLAVCVFVPEHVLGGLAGFPGGAACLGKNYSQFKACWAELVVNHRISVHLGGLCGSVVPLESSRLDFEDIAIKQQWKGKEKEEIELGEGKECFPCVMLCSHDRARRSLFR